MKKIILVLLSIYSFVTFGQLTNKGDVIISSGTTVYISGIDVINDNGTTHTWSNNGTLIFKGDTFTNNGTMDENASGTTEFSGANEQTINGSSVAYFHQLNIANANNSVNQESFVDTDNMNVADGAKDFDYKVATDKSLTVHDALVADGDIRLKGTSQLVQTHTGTSQVSGSKYVWVDQQGTSNQYRYNFWSSPVNQGGTWKLDYLKDGANGDDENKSSYPGVNYIFNNTSATGDISNSAHPVTLNSYWIWTLENGPEDDYTAWTNVQNTGAVNPGVGYTMKGPGVKADLSDGNGSNTGTYDSWTFSGSPNDGEYSYTIDQGNVYLIGNPYPSALDADQFIIDNTSNGGSGTDVFNGTLYFWDHVSGDSHYIWDYNGGYGTYTLTGGIAATHWDTGATLNGADTPQRYIPVGQGFGIWAESNQGGTFVFNNGQRVFETEGANSVFIRPVALTDIRLGFNTMQGYHRQILLGVRDNTTEGIDVGWDGPNFDGDSFAGADATWNLQDREFVIQAVPVLDADSQFPLIVKATEDGVVSFVIDEEENLPADISGIYIWDRDSDTYHPINNGNIYELYLQSGDYKDRFVMVFNDPNATSAEELVLDNVTAYFDNKASELVVLNPENQNIKGVSLFALTGQEVLSQNINSSESQIRVPAQLSTGMYLVRVISDDNKVYTSKLIIK